MSLLSFVLIGWINGSYAGGVVNVEFETAASCEVAKVVFIRRHRMKLNDDDRYSDSSWVQCVEK